MTKQTTTKAAAPAAPAKGDNQRAMLTQTTTLAASAETARAALVAHITAICEGADEGFLRDVRVAAMTGFVAGMIATKAGRLVTADDVAAGAVILAKGSKGSPDEQRMQNAARQRWHQIMEKAREAAPVVAAAAPKSTAKAEAAKATQAKRKARAGEPKITVTTGRTSKAANTGMAPTTNPAIPVMDNKAAAVAEIHQRAALLMAFVEKNTKTLGSAATIAAKGACSALMKISAA